MCCSASPTVQEWGGVIVPPECSSGTLPGAALCTRVQAGGVCHGSHACLALISPEYCLSSMDALL